MKGNIFNSVPFAKVKSSAFDLSHDVKMSFQMGRLVPTCLVDCVPGDIFEISVENMLRLAPLVSPVMHDINVDTHYFFVPNRLLWPEWEDFITGEADVVPPQVTLDEFTVSRIADYMGLPDNHTKGLPISAFPGAAYALIYDEFYRDQNLRSEVFEGLVAGLNGDNDWVRTVYGSKPYHRAWQHDYFTSSLPWAQKGDDVILPLGTSAPVDYIPGQGKAALLRKASDDSLPGGTTALQHEATTGSLENAFGTDYFLDPNDTLQADLANAEGVDINTVRRAFKLQEWLEKNARGGTRYIENILAHFGVRSSDSRMHRPEYIGGSKQKMVISEVLSTAHTFVSETETPVGNMAGHGISVGGGNRFRYRCEEHGWILGIISVRPKTGYQQGIPKMFSRTDKLDYFWPSFANLGEQPVMAKEIYAESLVPNADFGYVPRYAEYKFINGKVAGEMRDTLAHWHLGRIFADTPALNASFVECNPDTRIFAVDDPDADHIYAHIFNNLRGIRKMPKFGVPSL